MDTRLMSAAGGFAHGRSGRFCKAPDTLLADRSIQKRHKSFREQISFAVLYTHVIGIGLLFLFGICVWRLFDLMVLQHRVPETRGNLALSYKADMHRADIVDRREKILATSLLMPALFANPQEIRDAELVVSQLAAILDVQDSERLERKLKAENRFAWIHRTLTPRQQNQITQLGNPGLYFKSQYRRVYPQESLTPHAVGFTDLDGKGLAGLERSFHRRIQKETDRPLVLSIDMRLQFILREELLVAKEKFDPKAAVGIILDVNSGEVLAIDSLPALHPGNVSDSSNAQRFQRASLGVYELGSVFKLFTTAIAIDSGIADPQQQLDISKPLRVGGFTIHDFAPYQGSRSVAEILSTSSNIGSARLALRIGRETQQAYLRKLQLFTPLETEIAEVGMPIYPEDWRDVHTATISYGHGIAISPLQFVQAASAVINGGWLYPITFLKNGNADVQPTRIFQAHTSLRMRHLLRQAVLQGTGRRANVPGFAIGGKTGTANKILGEGYDPDTRIASFFGFFSERNPQYAIFVMLDEPKLQPHDAPTSHTATGGVAAAPVAARIIRRMSVVLGLPRNQHEVEAEQEHLLAKEKQHATH